MADEYLAEPGLMASLKNPYRSTLIKLDARCLITVRTAFYLMRWRRHQAVLRDKH